MKDHALKKSLVDISTKNVSFYFGRLPLKENLYFSIGLVSRIRELVLKRLVCRGLFLGFDWVWFEGSESLC